MFLFYVFFRCLIFIKTNMHKGNSVKVFGNIFISFIGAGVLGLPYAFKEVILICFFLI